MTTGNDQFGVIWDFDGTLIDSMPTHFGAWQRFMREHNVTFTEKEFLSLAGMSAEETLQHYFKDVSPDELARMGDLKNSYYREVAARDGIIFAPGAVELLKVLHEDGFKQAIGSGTHMQNLEVALGQYPWLRDYLEVIVVADHVSRTKPDPEIFLLAAQNLGLPPRNCLVIEDGLLGIEAAKRAGMASVALRWPGQVAADFLARGAAQVVDSLTDLTPATVLELIERNGQPVEQAVES